ncbi:hypothetical protein [Pseudorhodoferax sp.]|uniref:hypothetical protein n=1 Tax=Pseudorhodoferax sp. TaxID=1993553 RepID=UPI0039E6EFC5
MKYVHMLCAVIFFVSLLIVLTGNAGIAGIFSALGLIIEVVSMALTGKQSNDGTR